MATSVGMPRTTAATAACCSWTKTSPSPRAHLPPLRWCASTIRPNLGAGSSLCFAAVTMRWRRSIRCSRRWAGSLALKALAVRPHLLVRSFARPECLPFLGHSRRASYQPACCTVLSRQLYLICMYVRTGGMRMHDAYRATVRCGSAEQERTGAIRMMHDMLSSLDGHLNLLATRTLHSMHHLV
jgi:hypothetical protein